MTFSLNTIRSTFRQTTTSGSGVRMYVNTNFSNNRILNTPQAIQTPQAQTNFVKKVNISNPTTYTSIPFLPFTGNTTPVFTQNIVPSTVSPPIPIINISNSSSATGSVFAITSPPDTQTTISLSSSFFGESFFTGTSAFFIPARGDLLETTVGKPLLDEEKPKIVASIIENVRSDGFGRKNSLVIKKLKSSRATASYYRIFKKNMYEDSDFQEIVRIPADTITVDPKYNDLLTNLGLTNKEAFIFSDSAIKINNIYIYKVQVDWYLSTKTAQEIFNDEFQSTGLINLT